MTVVTQIRQHIGKIPAGEPFLQNIFNHLGSPNNVRKILSRMAQSGEIKRVARGIFVKPKQVPHMGKSLPSSAKVVATIAKKTGEKVAIHGAEAARRLHLTTQVPMQVVLYTTGNSRQIKTSTRTISLKHISPRKLVAPGTTAGTVISALWYLGQKNVTLETIQTIASQLSAEEFMTVLQEINHMPAWMAKAFFVYQREKHNEQ